MKSFTLIPEHEEPAPAPTCASLIAQALDHLSALVSSVDRIAASPELLMQPALRAQMRRSALDALSYAAQAGDDGEESQRQRLLLRASSALNELQTYCRMARLAAAGPEQLQPVNALILEAGRALRLGLGAERPASAAA